MRRSCKRRIYIRVNITLQYRSIYLGILYTYIHFVSDQSSFFFSRSLNVLSAQLIYIYTYIYRLDSSFTLAIRREREVKKRMKERKKGLVMVNFLLLSFMYINYRLSFNRCGYNGEKEKKMNE